MAEHANRVTSGRTNANGEVVSPCTQQCLCEFLELAIDYRAWDLASCSTRLQCASSAAEVFRAGPGICTPLQRCLVSAGVHEVIHSSAWQKGLESGVDGDFVASHFSKIAQVCALARIHPARARLKIVPIESCVSGAFAHQARMTY